MAYISGFTYDIFISYAHLDNEKLSSQTAGWIEQFYKDLNLLLLRRIGNIDSLKIWWDKGKLDGSKLFDQSIEEGIKQSAIMICLTSPGYLGSNYCKKELDLFYKKAQQDPIGLKVEDRSRILNVLLNNIPYKNWPVELSGTSGFHFHDSKDNDNYGDPLNTDSPEYRTQLQKLRDAIMKIIESFPKEEKLMSEEAAPEENEEESFSIYMGEVADTLRSTRKRSIIELEKKGYKILCGVPPPDEEHAHEKKVKECLTKANLSVHLFDLYPGKELSGAQDMWYPQKQAELGLQFSKSKLVWLPSELEIDAIEDEPYKQFIKGLEEGKQTSESYEFIRGCKSTLTQEIISMAEQVKVEQRKQKGNEKVSVLLDTHFNDQIYALDLSKTLLTNNIQPYINPQEDDPRKNISSLSDRISQVSKLIFLYGQVSREWLLARMSVALQLIITNNFPVEDFYIFLAPPRKDPNDISLKQRFLRVNIVDNSNNINVDTNTLHQLLKNLKGEV